jgi:phosphate starvation-inducible PhoH-like protein
MFLTRLGFGSLMVVTGDITQIDLPRGRQSGLALVPQVLGDIPDISFITFDQRDVVRHKLVQRIVAAYKEYGERTEGERDAGRRNAGGRDPAGRDPGGRGAGEPRPDRDEAAGRDDGPGAGGS